MGEYLSRLGGPDPLDYITIYRSKTGSKETPHLHWHYVTSGFSDLHGDGRVHE
jgi:suppressor of fused-like protein